jgi:hypothetical protein
MRSFERNQMFQMALRQMAASELRVTVNGMVFTLRGDPEQAVDAFFRQMAGLPRILARAA